MSATRQGGLERRRLELGMRYQQDNNRRQDPPRRRPASLPEEGAGEARTTGEERAASIY